MTAAYSAAGARDSAGRARRRLRRPDQRVARRHGEQPVHRRVPRRRVDPHRLLRRPGVDGAAGGDRASNDEDGPAEKDQGRTNVQVRRVFVDPGSPQRDAIQEAAKWILNGGVVALPTDTLYGLAADPFSPAAVARVFAVKGRDAERALPLIAADAGAGRRAPRPAVGDGRAAGRTVLAGTADAAGRGAARAGARGDGRHGTRRRAGAGRRRGAGDLPRGRPSAHGDERERQRRAGDGRPGSWSSGRSAIASIC